MSSVEEDECFYDVVSLDDSQNAFYYSFPTRSLSLKFETNLGGLAMDCKQISKSDQVPELSETYLIESKKQLSNDDSYLGILSNMMEKETHVDSVSSDEQTDICQIIYDIVKDQSEVYRKAEEAISDNMMEKETHVDSVSSDEQTDICQIIYDIVKDQSEVYREAEEAISGLSQSNQWRLGKSDGKPGTPLPATKSDR